MSKDNKTKSNTKTGSEAEGASKKVHLYTKGAVGCMKFDGTKWQITIAPSASYSQSRGEVKCIALYEKGKETKSSGVRFCDDKKAFDVGPKVSVEWLLQQKKNGSEIKFVFDGETIVGIEL